MYDDSKLTPEWERELYRQQMRALNYAGKGKSNPSQVAETEGVAA